MKRNKFYRALKSLLGGLKCCLMMLLFFRLQETELSSTIVSELEEPSNVSFYYYIDEDVAEGSVIADLSIDFTRIYHVDEEERQQLTFLMFDQSTDVVAKLFDVDDRTGVLTTTMMSGRRLDREELCAGSREECVLSFDVVVQPHFQLVKVKVEVLDINDNAPVIELADDGAELYESAEIGTELHVGTARDLDSLLHGIDSCRLENTQYAEYIHSTGFIICSLRHIEDSQFANTDSADPTQFFSLIIRRRLDDVRVVDLYVRLISTLDRETDGDFLVSICQCHTR